MEVAFCSEYWHLLNRQHNFTSQMTVIVTWALARCRMSDLCCSVYVSVLVRWFWECFVFYITMRVSKKVSLQCLYFELLILSSNKNRSYLFVPLFYYICT